MTLSASLARLGRNSLALATLTILVSSSSVFGVSPIGVSDLTLERGEVQYEVNDICASPPNPVVAENCRQGSEDWHINHYRGDIFGFVSATSVAPGQELAFYVNSDASYDLSIFRSGYYHGTGGRLVSTVRDMPGRAQPACLKDQSTGLFSCSNWSVSYRLTVPADWVSGVYFVKLVRHDSGGEYGTVFVIRDDNRKSDILLQLSVTTYQAYNSWDGKCLYSSLSWDYCPTVSEASRAVKASFDRPYAFASPYFQNTYFWTDYPMVYWLEAQGYDVSYFTNIDTHHSGKPNDHNKLLDHRVFLVVGHDEYWSQEMRDAITAARDAGVHLGFFSSNVSYWRIRLEPDPWTGQPDRVVVTYKTTESGPPDPSGQPTGTWRDPEGANDPENALIGVEYIGDNDARYFPLRVTAEQAKDQIYRHTGLQGMPSDTYVDIGRHLIGWEWDAVVNNGHTPEGLVVLAASPVYGGLLFDAGRLYYYHPAVANVTRYTAPSGAIVFASGTNQWAWGLAIFEPDRRIQQITYNLLADMGIHPTTPADTLVLDDAAPFPAASGTREERDQAIVSAVEELMRNWAAEDFEMPAGSLTAENAFLPEGAAVEPTISNVAAAAGQDKVTISWKTDRPADGHVWIKVQPGPLDFRMTTTSPGARPIAAEAIHETLMRAHELTMTGLQPNTTYYYGIASGDAAGHTALSVESSFQTQRGSFSTEVKNSFQSIYRGLRCQFLANKPLAIGLAITLILILGLAAWFLARARRGRKQVTA